MKPSRVFLIGPPAAGKTTLGRRWALGLGVPFWDTDQEIEKRTGRSIAEWFAEGEVQFRRIEWAIIQDLLQEKKEGIFSIGGGFPAQAGAMELLLQSGYVLWIDPPHSWIMARLRETAAIRPLLRDLSPSAQLKLIEKRRAFYRQADLHWRPDKVPELFIQMWLQRVLRVFSAGTERAS